MNIEGKTIWQQAAGDKDRNYVDVCLEWGVILNGPGYLGPLDDATMRKLREHGRSAKTINKLKSFKDGMKAGDMVVLRLGTDQVHAVGEVVGDYQWSSLFGDVDGWDIEHVRRVRWQWVAQGSPKTFDSYTMKLGDTTQKLTSPEVKKWLEVLVPNVIDQEKALPEIPLEMEAGSTVPMAELAEHMFDNGASSTAINQFSAGVDELVRIYKWYGKDKKNRPSEHETVAYLVVPFLRALGWTPQRMAIEWGRIDVALFSKLPRIEENLACVVEVKNLDTSCLKAREQAKQYTEKWGPNCTRFIVTDGLRYGVYEKERDDFQLKAYMNLNRRYDKYAIYNCEGVRAAIMALTPERISDPSVFGVTAERVEVEA